MSDRLNIAKIALAILAGLLLAGCASLFEEHPDWPPMEPSPEMVDPYNW